MKSIITLFLIIFFFKVNGQSKIDTINLKLNTELTWNGKVITKKALDDSLRVAFFKYCDCLEPIKRKKYKKKLKK